MRVLTDPLGFFTLDVPADWESRTEDGVTILADPHGHGMLYLCGARHARGQQLSFGRADFLVRFLRSISIEVDESEVALQAGTGCRIYSLALGQDGAFWHYWSVTDDETALLISYTCPAGEEGKDQDALEHVVRSVRLYHSAPH